MAQAELGGNINPATGFLIKSELMKLPVYAMPTAGYLSRVIPGLDVDLEHFVGVWEGKTTVMVTPKIFDDAKLRIECGSEVTSQMIKSTITIISALDRIRETWVIRESKEEIDLNQKLEVVQSMTSRSVSRHLGDFTLPNRPGVKFLLGPRPEDKNPLIRTVKKPSDLPVLTSEQTGYNPNEALKKNVNVNARDIWNDLRGVIVRAKSGISSPELRSQITERNPIPLSDIWQSNLNS